MQIAITESRHMRKFLIVAGAILGLLVAFWYGLNRFDNVLGQARTFISSEQEVVAKLGRVEGTTLYKFRYMDIREGEAHCFAEYFFFVSGEGKALLDVRVRACGERTSPSFSWRER